VFGALGVAAKILGWNRFLIFMGAAFGDRLEQALRQTLMLAQGDPALVVQPIGGTLLLAAIVILASAAVFSLKNRDSF
jgi:TctA family transporter